MNLSLLNNRIDWLRVYLEADTLGEEFDDVHIVTLKGEIVAEATIEAINSLPVSEVMTTPDSMIDFMTHELIAAGMISSQEYVLVDKHGIEVCIDADSTENPDTLSCALDMVAEALDKLDGKHGTIYFSEPKTYVLTDIPWLITQ